MLNQLKSCLTLRSTRVAIEISFRKNSAEWTRNGFRYSAEKSAHSAEFRVHRKSQFRNSEPNGTKLNSAEIMKFYEIAKKGIVFLVFSVPKNGLERIFKCFLFRKWFGKEFQVFFLPKTVQNRIPKFSLLKKVRKGLPRFYH